MCSFWSSLPRPFFVLAPMANVTDSVFRKLFAKYGKPDVTWTEFVSADGLVSAGQKKLLVDLEYTNKERPIVAQLFTGHPEVMREAAVLVKTLGFDGLDINMGCPDRAVEKQGGGAALIKDTVLALKVLEAARDGVDLNSGLNQKSKIPTSLLRSYEGQSKSSFSAKATKDNQKLKAKGEKFQTIPVSVKTRIGYNKIDLNWIKFLLEQKLPALTVHLRTRKEMSEVPAHWEIMPEIIKMRNEIAPATLIIGNGDVESLEQAREYSEKYGCDGIMIGRGIFGKPWFFEGLKKLKTGKSGLRNILNTKLDFEKTPEERLKILVEHAKLFEKTFLPAPTLNNKSLNKNGLRQASKNIKNFDVMKKHFKAYVSGWDGAKELRVKLFEAEYAKDVAAVVKEYIKER